MKIHAKICLSLLGLIFFVSSQTLANAQDSEIASEDTLTNSLENDFSTTDFELDPSPTAQPNEPEDYRGGTFLGFLGTDGSKQPQDFGANANVGAGASIGYSAPLLENKGIGFQIGTRVTFTGNGVQVFELLGEAKDRFQSFTTVGVFQRLDNGVSFGAAYDFLTQESFDNFTLSQWRVRASIDISPVDELGVTINLSDRSDTGFFNATPVELQPIEQLQVYIKHRWQSGVETSTWIGVADAHSEENVVTGTLPRKTNQITFGSEFHAPLNQWLAIYGETNLIMPADTGAIDAFLGMQFAPQGVTRSRSRKNRFRAFLPVASNPSFTTDLNRR